MPDVLNFTHRDWTPEEWIAVATFALAIVTGTLAFTSAMQVRISRRAHEAAMRPLLVDVPLGSDGEGEVDISCDVETSVVDIELPVRNAGTGLALLTAGPMLNWEAGPNWHSAALVSAVPAGEETRFDFRVKFPDSQTACDAAEAIERLEIEVAYTDANGGQLTRTKAYVIKNPTEESLVDYYVDRIDLFRGTASEAFAKLSGRAAN